MKLRGEFVTRRVLDDVVVIPVGETALRVGGMIMLNEVSLVIWQCLEQDTSEEEILQAVTAIPATRPICFGTHMG